MDLSSVTELRDRLRNELARGAHVLEGVELAIAALEQSRGGVLLNTPTPKLAPPARRARRTAKAKAAPRKSQPEHGKAPRARRSPDAKTVAQLERLSKLWAEGKKAAVIAKATGISLAMVYYHAKKLGLTPRRDAKSAETPAAPRDAAQLGAEIAARSKRGQWDQEIATALDVSLADVRAALVRAGIRQSSPALSSP